MCKSAAPKREPQRTLRIHIASSSPQTRIDKRPSSRDQERPEHREREISSRFFASLLFKGPLGYGTGLSSTRILVLTHQTAYKITWFPPHNPQCIHKCLGTLNIIISSLRSKNASLLRTVHGALNRIPMQYCDKYKELTRHSRIKPPSRAGSRYINELSVWLDNLGDTM